MNVQETTEIRELTGTELDYVSGAFSWSFLSNFALGVGIGYLIADALDTDV
jgi:hypothetical protein